MDHILRVGVKVSILGLTQALRVGTALAGLLSDLLLRTPYRREGYPCDLMQWQCVCWYDCINSQSLDEITIECEDTVEHCLESTRQQRRVPFQKQHKFMAPGDKGCLIL